ncbi:MAG: S1-like domain-containing RNA-binding protein [Lachnospiraceae bacterium]|nr:S1-like domain-containing RNA-binding protein [Lachnospiraceae bacterium]
MLKLGEKQSLKVVKEVEFGIYLAADNPSSPDERVMLPIKQKPAAINVGDYLDVFIYRDSKDRLIATTNTPLISISQTARLRVAEVAKIGAFLDWGLEKDLLLPFREQTRKLHPGDQVLVALYIDKSDRLCATMKVYHHLFTNSPYIPNAMVTGEVYEISGNFGAFVAVDDKYSALIPPNEIYGELKVGDIVNARITAIKPDGKIDLAIRPKAYLKIGDDAENVFAIISADFAGTLPFTDKASPEQIREVFAMSKNEFKRAIGNLLKAQKIVINDNNIQIKNCSR